MPIELNFIKIEFHGFRITSQGGTVCALHFKVEPGKDGKKFLDVFFSDIFVEDYFRLESVKKDIVEKIYADKQKLFLNWGLVKIEGMLNDESFKKEVTVSSKDSEWAKKVEDGRIIPLSEAVEENIFRFFPEQKGSARRIRGFKP